MKKKETIEKKEEYYSDSGAPMLRPELHLPRVFAIVVFYLLLDVAGCLFATRLAEHYQWFSLVSMEKKTLFILLFFVLLLFFFFLHLKQILIFMIRVYQRYAPYETRDLCVFIPSCSEYMALAIQKYGVIKGIRMGIDRLKRCESPGGIDYP